MSEQERNSLSLADRLNAEALVKRQRANKESLSVTEELLLQAGGYASQENVPPQEPVNEGVSDTPAETIRQQPSPEGPRPILTLNGPVDPKTFNLESERYRLDTQLFELTLAEEELRKVGSLSDSARKQLISIDRKRALAKKRMGEIDRTLTEMREITRNAFPPHSVLAPETSRVRAPQYWRGTTVAETPEPATIIDEEAITPPISMESPSPSPQEATRHDGKDLAAKLAERVAGGESINPETILDPDVRARVAQRINGDGVAPRIPSETPINVSVADLEAEDAAATEIPRGETVAEEYAEIQTVVDALPKKEMVAATEGEPVSVTVSDAEKTPESASWTTSLGVAPDAEVLQTQFETSLRKIHDRDPEQANRILNTLEGKDGPVREKFLKLITATETQREEQVERAQKSLSEKAFGFVKNMGERYQRLPLAAKVSLGLALSAGALLSSGALGAVFATGVVGRRMLAGAATAVTVEAALHRYHERKGGTRTEAQEKRDRWAALIAGALGASAGSLISMASDALESSGAANATAARIAELKQELGLGLPPREEASLLMNDPGPTVGTEPASVNFSDPDFGKSVAEGAPLEKIEVTIKPGDNLWNIIKEKVDAQQLAANLTPDQKTYFIDSIKDKFAAMSPEELKTIGFENGNIDMIRAGKTIDLTNVLGDTSFLPEALHDAEMFSGHLAEATPEAAAGISEQVATAPGVVVEDLPASITETPVDDLPANRAPVMPENVLRDGSGEVVRDGFGDPVRTGEGALLDQPYTREQFSPKELSRLNDAITAGPERGLADSLNVIYPPADGEVWTVGEKSASWVSMKGQSAWELFYRPESLDPSVSSNPSTPKLRAFMQGLSEYDIQPERSETVEGFLKRALAVVAEKSPNQTWSA